MLLVDDVVTTGSTLLSCTEALLRAVPTVGSALLHWPFRAAISDWIGNFDRVVFAFDNEVFRLDFAPARSERVWLVTYLSLSL